MRKVHFDDALEYYFYQTTFNQNGSLFKSYDTWNGLIVLCYILIDVGMQCI